MRAPRKKILKEAEVLTSRFPNAKCSINFKNRFELLVCTVLSAQSTDKRVNLVSPTLFSAFPGPKELAQGSTEEIEKIIKPLGMYKIKAQSIKTLSKQLEATGWQVPGSMEELVKLKGVGRKTANVVLAEGFSVPGFAVDTHVTRTTSRLHWHSQWSRPHPDPVIIERELCQTFPPESWAALSRTLIEFGREICHAKKPECALCPLKELCPFAKHS